MHIIGVLVAVLSALGVWIWRLQRAKDGLDAVADAAGHMKGAYNRHRFREKSKGSILANVDDPAEAAAVFLTCLAAEKRPLTDDDENAISHLLETRAGVRKGALQEAMAFARWASGEVADSNDVVRRFLPLWRRALTMDQRADLVSMATTVCEFGGEAAPVQRALVRRMREGLLD